TAVASPTPDLARRFIDYFGAHPLADEARESLLARTGATESKLEEELLLRQLETSTTPDRSGQAVARVAKLLHDSQRGYEAAAYIARLQGPLASTRLLDGKTGAELVRTWFGEQPPAAFRSLSAWPNGKVEVERGNSSTIQQGVQNFPIDVRGPAGPFFQGWTVELVYHPQQALVAKDRLGREQWRVAVADPQNRNGFFFQQQALNAVRFDGHLLVASLGFQLIGIDTLGSGKDGPRVLWRQDLIDPVSRDHGGMNWRQVNLPWGAPRIWAFDSQGRPLGATGPLTRDGVCFQRLRNLICVHPFTGKTLWTRYGIPPGSELFGDDEYLFVVTSTGERNNVEQEATVYRMLDGQELGKRKVPPLEQRLMTLGRKVLVWSTKNEPTVTLRDLWLEKDEWTRKFAVGAKPWPIGEEAVAVLQRDGQFMVLNATDGQATINVPLRDETNLSDLAVHRSAERDFLFVNRPPKNGDGFGLHVVPQGGQGISVLNGWVYAFDRATGKLVWERAIERRSVSHHQPPDLPVIVFASLQQVAGGNGQQVSLMALDKRDGRVLFDEKFPNQGPALEMTAAPEKNEVAVRLNRGQTRLTFTDKAVPADKPAEGTKPAAEADKAKGDEKK
ncbi:MAG: PQQ-binding-like beta-propeller repeat protein, partial [Planctomycetaceae bacterium]|nr:PQQ-binding-like beta-propeller repeat protein [Planctomycetaceae bacterium]